MTSATRARTAWVEAHVREHCFGAPASDRLTFGAELELLAFEETTHAIAPIYPNDHSAGSIEIARDVGRCLAWRDPQQLASEIDECEVVINVTGRSVNWRYTAGAGRTMNLSIIR